MDLWDLQITDFKVRFFFSFFSYFSEDKLLAPPTVRSEPLCAVKGAFSFSTRTGDKQAVK